MLPKVSTDYFTVCNTDDPAVTWPAGAEPNRWREHTGAPGADVLRIRALTGAELLGIEAPEAGDKRKAVAYLHAVGIAGVHPDDRARFASLPLPYQVSLGVAVQNASSPEPDPTTPPSST